jgi:hypothetical protein
MAITLEGIVLSPSMQWTDRYDFSPVAQTMQLTLGGGVVVYSQGLTCGRPVTLEALDDTGWITKAMLDALDDLAAVPGAVYTLTIHDFAASVVFRHNDPPAVGFKPLQPKSAPTSGDYFIGTLKFLTV